MNNLQVYQAQDSDSGQVVNYSNSLLFLIDFARTSAGQADQAFSTQILHPSGTVIWAIKAGQTQPHIDESAHYPAFIDLPNS